MRRRVLEVLGLIFVIDFLCWFVSTNLQTIPSEYSIIQSIVLSHQYTPYN
jgi:hypothetical protein